MHKRNIFLINRFFFPDISATSQLLSDLAFYLSRKGYKVTVICSNNLYDGTNKNLPGEELINGVRVYRVKTTNFGRFNLVGRVVDYFSYFFGMSIKLLNYVKYNDVIIAKTDPPLTSFITLPIAKIKKAKHINWVQDLFPEVALSLSIKAVPSMFSNLISFLRNISFRLSTMNVVIGRVMKDKLLELNISESRLKIISNWSDGSNISPLPHNLNPLRIAWRMEGKFVLAYSGNMGRAHEFDTILNAAEKLKHEVNIVFVFIGGGAQRPYILEQVKLKKLNNVVFKPYQAYKYLKFSLTLPDVHLISLLPEIEGYCVPSKYYGILASGRPAIFVGDIKGEIAMLIDQEGTGEVVQRGRNLDLVSLILKLVNDPEKVAFYGKNSRKVFNSYYDKPVSLKRWFDVLDGV